MLSATVRIQQDHGCREGRITKANNAIFLARENFLFEEAILTLRPKRKIAVITEKKGRKKFQAANIGWAKA